MAKRRASALSIAQPEAKITAPATAIQSKFCVGCQTQHQLSAFLPSRFTVDGLTDKCPGSIRKAAERDRLAREKRQQELEAKIAASPATTKCCRACKTAKPLNEFTRHRLSKDGHRHDCKDCVTKGRAKKRPPLTPEQKQAARERSAQPYRRVATVLAVKAWRVRNPEAVTANRTVERAVRNGRITPAATCEAIGCESSDRLHAHHNDYKRARSVIWLCGGHHRQVHNGRAVRLKRSAGTRTARAPKTK
jgi:hypothetical protein